MPATLKNIIDRIHSRLEYERTAYPDVEKTYLKIHPSDYAEYVKHEGHADFYFTYTESAKTHKVIVSLYPLGQCAAMNVAAPYYKRLRQITSEATVHDAKKTTIALGDIKNMLDDSIHAIDRMSGNYPRELLLHMRDYASYVNTAGKTTYRGITLQQHI